MDLGARPANSARLSMSEHNKRSGHSPSASCRSTCRAKVTAAWRIRHFHLNGGSDRMDQRCLPVADQPSRKAL